MYTVSINALLKVVGYFDLSVLSMSVMGFHKKSLEGLGGWGELYPIFFFNFAKTLNLYRVVNSECRSFHVLTSTY